MAKNIIEKNRELISLMESAMGSDERDFTLEGRGASEYYDHDRMIQFDEERGVLVSKMIAQTDRRSAFRMGWRDSADGAMRAAGYFPSKFKPNHYVRKGPDGKWQTVYPYAKNNETVAVEDRKASARNIVDKSVGMGSTLEIFKDFIRGRWLAPTQMRTQPAIKLMKKKGFNDEQIDALRTAFYHAIGDLLVKYGAENTAKVDLGNFHGWRFNLGSRVVSKGAGGIWNDYDELSDEVVDLAVRYLQREHSDLFETSVQEKAVSVSQQQAAGAALAAKRGEISVSSLEGASRKMYDGMTEKELEDFAGTKHAGLPHKKSSMNETWAPMDQAQDHSEIVSYGFTKQHGDATVNVSATASDLEDLRRVLDLVGLHAELPGENQHDQDVISVDMMPDIGDHDFGGEREPEMAMSPCDAGDMPDYGDVPGYEMDKQKLYDELTAKLKGYLS